jgi:hypothetical protein
MSLVVYDLATRRTQMPVPVTLVSVRTISITLSIPITRANPCKGRPTLDKTTVAIIEAVPGTPAVPIVAMAAVIIINMYCKKTNQCQTLEQLVCIQLLGK